MWFSSSIKIKSCKLHINDNFKNELKLDLEIENPEIVLEHFPQEKLRCLNTSVKATKIQDSQAIKYQSKTVNLQKQNDVKTQSRKYV